jgi:ribosomal protein L33
MSQLHLATLRCKETGEAYVTRINKKRRAGFVKKDIKIALMKYSKKLRKKVLFQETKKMFK